MTRWLSGILTVLAMGSAAEVRADFGALGTAGGYGEFILGNSTRSYVDIQGKVAVGGNATFTGMEIASKKADGPGVNLVVGGKLSVTSGSIHGSAVVGGNASLENPTLKGNLNANGQVKLDAVSYGGTISGNVTYGTTFQNGFQYNSGVTIGGTVSQGTTSLPIDFASESAFLNGLSAAQVGASDPSLVISNTPPAGTPFYFAYNQLFVNLTTKGDYFFNVTFQQLAAATSGIVITAPTDSTVVFNVSGTGVGLTLPNSGYTYNNGFAVDHLLFNFYQATEINLAGSVHGTFLAPKATVNTTSGGFNGNLIALNLNGNIESHIYDYGSGPNTLFRGNLRSQAVPEPASLSMMLVGSLGAAFLRRQRKRAA